MSLFHSNIQQPVARRVHAQLHVHGRRESEFLLHTLNLPPSPQPLDLGYPPHEPSSFQLFHLEPLATFGSWNPLADNTCWRPFSEDPVRPPPPTSPEGFGSTSPEYQRYDSFCQPPIMAAEFSASGGLSYPQAPTATSGLNTPPASSSSQSSSIDFNHQHLYSHLSTSYYLPEPHGSYMYGPSYGCELPQDSPFPTSSAAQRSPGDSPTSRYLYAQHRTDACLPSVQPYRQNDTQGLPWQKHSEPIPPPIVGPYSPAQWHESSSASYRNDTQKNGYECTSARCTFAATTLEQLTKHQQKHMKLYHCRFPSCSRTEGFATPNDRERHEKSIHKIPGCYWKCLDSHCSSYGKEFSRRDNLKDHLRRMHPVLDGMGETEASAMRSRMADMWRFDKGTNAVDSLARDIRTASTPL